ncbi:MAG: hypothetical protein MMC23_001658 [Stictis urceolatum]|nr:hypothetical protein [Stictis urceolata]
MGEAFNQRDKQNVIGQEGLNHSYSLAAGIIRDASDERHDEERNINGPHNGASRVLAGSRDYRSRRLQQASMVQLLGNVDPPYRGFSSLGVLTA